MTLHEFGSVAVNWVATFGLHLGAPAVSGVFALIGAADSTGIGSLVGVLGPSGVLAWYVWYNVKYVLPAKDTQLNQMTERHEKSEQANRDHYEMVITRQHEFHREQREEDRRVLNRVADSSDRVAATLERMTTSCSVEGKAS